MDWDGQERRATALELQQSVLKILSSVEVLNHKVDTMESNVDLKLETVKGKISNVEEKLVDKVKSLEIKMADHFEENGDMEQTVEEHDKLIQKASSHITRIDAAEVNIQTLWRELKSVKKEVGEVKADIATHKLEPTVKTAKEVNEFVQTVKKALYGAAATGIVGFVGWVIYLYFHR